MGYIKGCVFEVVSLILIISSLVFGLPPRSIVARSAVSLLLLFVRMPPGVKIEGARGVDVEVSVHRVVATGLDGRGVLTSCWGTGTRTPRGRKRHKKAQRDKEMVPRFRTGCLAFDGRDPSLLPTPRRVLIPEKYISPWVDSLICVIPFSSRIHGRIPIS
ncbi:hypothetical protein BGW80DRAFT_771757 [Lactifluus volemus]|nr:hypothetical protein BGW80DRAFT_771757 [Lactifluus volemus]